MALALFSRALARPAFTRLSGATSWQRLPRCNSLAAASAAPAGGRSQAEGWRLQHSASGSSAACVVPPKVADLIDLHCGGPFGSPEQQASPLRVLAPGLRHYGGVRAFCGQVATIQCWESNVQVGRAQGHAHWASLAGCTDTSCEHICGVAARDGAGRPTATRPFKQHQAAPIKQPLVSSSRPAHSQQTILIFSASLTLLMIGPNPVLGPHAGPALAATVTAALNLPIALAHT